MLPSFSNLRRRSLHGIFCTTLFTCGFAIGAAHSAARPVVIEDCWINPDSTGPVLRSIAVLPAVTLNDMKPSHVFTDSLAGIFGTPAQRWMGPWTAWYSLGDSEIERVKLFQSIVEDVRSSGRTRAELAARIATRLHVDAILLTRVERWEQLPGNHDETVVQARAELVRADGTSLWRIAGSSRVFTETFRESAVLPPAAKGTPLTNIAAPTVVTSSGSGSGSSGSGGGSGTGSVISPSSVGIEKHAANFEDMVSARGPGQALVDVDPFPSATALLLRAWVDRLRIGNRAAATPDSTRR